MNIVKIKIVWYVQLVIMTYVEYPCLEETTSVAVYNGCYLEYSVPCLIGCKKSHLIVARTLQLSAAEYRKVFHVQYQYLDVGLQIITVTDISLLPELG